MELEQKESSSFCCLGRLALGGLRVAASPLSSPGRLVSLLCAELLDWNPADISTDNPVHDKHVRTMTNARQAETDYTRVEQHVGSTAKPTAFLYRKVSMYTYMHMYVHIFVLT